MSDEEQQQDQNDQREADQDDPKEAEAEHKESEEKTERDKTLARLSEERRQARERAQKAEARLTELEAKQREADEAKAKEDGRFKELLEQREAELADLKNQLTEREIADLRASIARKHNLPDDAVKYLTGDDEEAIETAAKDLAKLTARAEDIDTDSGKRDSSNKKKSKQSESLLASYKFGPRR